jgi:hypothetical protein
MEVGANSSESIIDVSTERRIMRQGLLASQELVKKVRESVYPPQLKFTPQSTRDRFLLEQLFLMHAVADNGKPLWRSLIIERQRYLSEISAMIKQLTAETPPRIPAEPSKLIFDFDESLKEFLSRKTAFSECQKNLQTLCQKMLDSVNKFVSYQSGENKNMKVKQPIVLEESEVQYKLSVVKKMQRQLLLRGIYNLKKILCSLHQRLQQVIVVQQASNKKDSKTSIWLSPFEDNAQFYC